MKRYHLPGLVLNGLLLLALLPAAPVAGSRAYQAEVDPAVWDTLQAKGEAEILIVLREQADLSAADALPTKEARGQFVFQALRAAAEAGQRDLRAALDAREATYQSFYIVSALKLTAGPALVQSLAARPDAARIELNPRVKGVPDRPEPALVAAAAGTEANLVRVGAPAVWALGYTGQGVVVGGNDTGVDWDHPALIDHYRPAQPGYGRHDFNWHDAIHAGTGSCSHDMAVPCDGYGHGTHTLGTLAGSTAADQIGMAPGARWIACRNMDTAGVGSPATYLECFEFLMAPYPVGGTPDQGNPALAPDVINNSWGCPPSEGCAAATLEAAVDAVRRAGIAVVASAGNYGYGGCGTVSDPPAIYHQTLTVGSFDHRTDQIAASSSRGPVTYGGQTYVKPDVAAPGVSVRSCVPGTGYEAWSGTSMAAPHVAGALALLLSAAPGYRGRVAALEQIIVDTADARISTQCGAAGPPNSVWGWGILDTLGAVQRITSGSIQGTVVDALGGAPIAGAAIQADPVAGSPLPGPDGAVGFAAGPQAVTGPNGGYALTLAAGTYDLAVSAPQYATAIISGVAITQTTTLDITLQRIRRYYVPLLVKPAE